MAALSPEEKAEFLEKIADFKSLIAQPAPVVTFYRDGIEAAAKWIDQQREAYDSEHGWSDPDTGSFEFGSEIKREYSSTLEELAEGIRAMHPNARSSPVIPDGWIPVSERMPLESGRYWCYVEEQNDLGKSHYQWNCSWNGDRWWIESENGGIVTHWMPLPAAPQEVK
ncbi:TPA: DUF551 domain-containing protein [Klebsiella pneumoniae subsp. pneumoniae]|nr:DUF551 domain-containing protein [Klebsiella pneumoniae subsp. pneumoniae]